MFPASDEFVKIAILESLIEAQLLGSLLEQHRIPHRIRSYHDTAYDGLFQIQKGWGELRAPRAHEAEILEILESLRRHPYKGPLDDENAGSPDYE